MDNASVFDLVGTHDAASAAATARFLFRRFCRFMLVRVGIALGLVLVGTIWLYLYSKMVAGSWIVGALLALEGVLLIDVRFRTICRLNARIGKTIRVRISAADVSWASEDEAHTLPWSRFKGVSTEGHNLYLLLTKTVVLSIPNQDDPEPAAHFAWSNIDHARGATAIR